MSKTIALALASVVATEPVKPHIIFILADDLGWNTAWNNADIISPSLDSLAEKGLKLTSQYAYRYCSPTRAAFLTGRSPYKLLNVRSNLRAQETTDPRFTFLPKRLQEAGYHSYAVGKWHLGMKAPLATPVGRGFQESYGFLAGAEDHFDSLTGPKCPVWGKVLDYFAQGGEFNAEGGPISTCDVADADRSVCPLFDVIKGNTSEAAATQRCVAGEFANCAYDEAVGASTPCYQCFAKRYTGSDFTDRAVRMIENHATQKPNMPMFMYLSLQNTHGPVQAPEEYCALYNFDSERRNTFNAMVTAIDKTVENVTAALRRTGMWENTLLIWTTDNGTPVQTGGSNDPFRGSKGSDWEGGVRVPTIITGGVLPVSMSGKSLDGIIAMWDYFATFCALAGVDPSEPQEESPASVDSFDVWPYLSGAVAVSPRNEIVLDHLLYTENSSACIYDGYIQVAPCLGAGAMRTGDYKIMVGTHGKATQFGHFTPNASYTKSMMGIYRCSMNKPCLFNVTADWSESHDLAEERPEDLAMMLEKYHAYDSEYHPPTGIPADESNVQCKAALHNGGFQTPWRTDAELLAEFGLVTIV